MSTPDAPPIHLIIHTDGAARGNPGPAAFGYAVFDADGEWLEGRGEFIGDTTSNVAEYKGMIAAARRAAELGAAEAEFRVDSELLERQVNGAYRVKAPHLRRLHAELMAALDRLPSWRVCHVRRAHNAEADRLANQALDARGVAT